MFEKSKLLHDLTWDADWVTAVSFLGASRRLAAGNNKGDILVWDLPAKVPVLRLDGHTNCVSRLRSSANGRWLYSSSYDKTLRVWDMKEVPVGKAGLVLNERTRDEIKRRPSSGRKMPVAIEADVGTQKATRVMEGHKDWVTAFDLSRDGKLILSGDDAGSAILWEARTGKEVRRWPLKGWAYAAALSPDAKLAVISERVPLIFDSGRHDSVKVWDVAAGKAVRDLGPLFKGQHMGSAVWSPDGKAILLGRGGECDGPNGIVHVIDAESGKKAATLPTPGHLNGMTDMLWHPDGKHLATCGRDTQIRIWDVAGKRRVAELGKPRGGQFKDWLHALSFSSDGKLLAAGDMAGAVQVWELA